MLILGTCHCVLHHWPSYTCVRLQLKMDTQFWKKMKYIFTFPKWEVVNLPLLKNIIFFLKKNILFCGQHFLMLIFFKNNEMCREIDTSSRLIFVGELTRSLHSSICSSYLAKCNRLTDIKNCLLENSHFKRNTFFITFFFKHGTFQYSCRSEVKISTRGGKHLICILVESPETVSSRKSAKMLQQQYYFLN